jgi:hypothetical protein
MVEIKVTPQDIDQVHRRRALGDGEPDYVVGYAGLLVVLGDSRIIARRVLPLTWGRGRKRAIVRLVRQLHSCSS